MTTLGWTNAEATATVTILLRHGDTRLSPEHRFSGLSDEPLSADGARQVSSAAHRLASGARIDAIVSSPLPRAAATAAMVAKQLALTAATARLISGNGKGSPSPKSKAGGLKQSPHGSTILRKLRRAARASLIPLAG